MSRASSIEEAVIPEWLLGSCRNALALLDDDCPNVRFASVCTEDGYELCGRGDAAASVKVSVIAGTVFALSSTIALESGLAQNRNVLVECDKGTALIVSVKGVEPGLVMLAVGGTQVNLAWLLLSARAACERIQSDARKHAHQLQYVSGDSRVYS